MSSSETWKRIDNRDDLTVAFFGERVATTAADLQPLLSPPPTTISWLRQVHSADVCAARPGLAGDGDALVSTESGLALAVATADCVPVLMAAPGRVAAVHAGWRGLAAGVLIAALETFGSAAADTEVWIGPAIGPCCYEIGHDVADQLLALGNQAAVSAGPTGRPHADLQAIARYQLGSVQQIQQIDLCTRCAADSLASYRRDGEAAGRNWSVIWRT